MKILRTITRTAPAGARAMSQLPGGLEGYGQDVFFPATMEQYVDADVYSRHLESISTGVQPTKGDKNAIADGLKKWAMERGATQFAHWFSPIRGANALKKDTFIGASTAFAGASGLVLSRRRAPARPASPHWPPFGARLR